MALTSACGMAAGHRVAGCWSCCWGAEARTGGALDSQMGGKVNMVLTSASGIYTRKKKWRDDVISKAKNK